MKKISYLMMMLFVATLSIGFTSCSSDDDEQPTTDSQGNPSIVGTWYYDSDEDKDYDKNNSGLWREVYTITFNANQTGSVISEITVDKGVAPNVLNGTFEWVLNWDKGVGNLLITNEKGSQFWAHREYTINGSASGVMLTTKSFIFGDYTFSRR